MPGRLRKEAASAGCVQREEGERSVGLAGQLKRCAVLWGPVSHFGHTSWIESSIEDI